MDNRGFGQHRNVLNQMQGGDTRDQNLIQILHDVINPEENKDDDDVADYDEDIADYDEDGVDNGNGEEISDGNGNGDVSETGNGASNNDYSDTSSYTNTTDKMPKDDTASATSPYDLSLSIEDGDKPQEKLNIDKQSRKHDGGAVEKHDVKGGKNQIPQTPKEKHDVNSDGVTVGEEKCYVNSGGPQTPKEKHDVNSDGVTVGEEKHPDTNPEPQEGDVNDQLEGEQQTAIVGEKPDTIDVNNKLSVIEIAPQQQVIDDAVQSEIVNLSGKIIIDSQTGNAYNIDDVDVSQFTEMFIVSYNDDPLQNYEKVTLQLLDDEIKKESDDNQKTVLEEIQVQQKHDVTEEKDDDVPEGEKREEKRDAVQKNKGQLDAVEPEEKRDVTEEKDDDVADEVVARIESNDNQKTVLEEIQVQQKHDVTEEKDEDVPEGEKREEKRDAVQENKGQLDAVEPEEKRDVTEEKDDDVADEVVARIECDVGESSLTYEDTECEKHEEKRDAVQENKDRKTEGKLDAVEANKDQKTEEKRDVSVSEEASVNQKRDVTVPEEEKSEVPEEKRDVTEAADSCSSRSEKIINTNKTTDSDYDSETEDTTDSTSDENYIRISKKSSHSDNADVITEVKCDRTLKRDRKTIEVIDLVSTSSCEENKKIQRDIEIDSDVQEIKQATEKRDVKRVLDVDDEKRERPDSPDNSTIMMSRKRCAIMDTVPRRREEIRSQYRCHLARKFIKTDYRYKSPNVRPELDFFEDEGDEFSQTNSDTTYKTTRSMTATSTNSCDNDSDDNSNEESVLYVTILFHVSC